MAVSDSDLLVRARAPEGAALPPSLYDFERPRAFSERHLRAAERVHAALAARLGAGLTTLVGETVGVRCTALHEIQTVDFERSRTLPTALFRLHASVGPLGLDLAPALALFLVERHLGGADPLGDALRALSPLEQRLTERHALPPVADALSAAWRMERPTPDAFETHASRLPLAAPEAPAVVADFEVAVGGRTAPVTLCYPAPTLHALLAGLDAAPPDGRPPETRRPGVHLDALPLTVRAELGRTRLRVADLLHLAPGDVIPLDRVAEAPVPVWIGDRLHAAARAGASGARLALHLLTPPAPLADPT